MIEFYYCVVVFLSFFYFCFLFSIGSKLLMTSRDSSANVAVDGISTRIADAVLISSLVRLVTLKKPAELWWF